MVHDSDGGTIDRDPVWDRAVGPMQFIPGTWRTVGVDADGDGVKNPQNLSDAATATAVYLCSGPGDLTQPTDLRSAIMRYNQSEPYVQQVIAIADGYRRGVSVLPAQALSAEQRNGSPYLPSGAEPSTGPGAPRSDLPRPASAPPAGRRAGPPGRLRWRVDLGLGQHHPHTRDDGDRLTGCCRHRHGHGRHCDRSLTAHDARAVAHEHPGPHDVHDAGPAADLHHPGWCAVGDVCL